MRLQIRLLAAVVLGAATLAAPAAAGASTAETVSDLLHRQTQEMADALASGDAAVWDRYLDPMVIFTSEDGVVMNKERLLAITKPLPPGASGRIKVIEWRAESQGDVTVTTYVQDEYETYHGHDLHCQYRSTDTWLHTGAGWRLIASQVLALRTDPPAVQLPAASLAEYCGRYSLDPTTTYEIRCREGALTGQQTGHDPEILLAEAPDVLFATGRPRYRMIFQRGPDGRITGFAERREAWSLVWKRLP